MPGERIVPQPEVIRAILLDDSPCFGVPAPAEALAERALGGRLLRLEADLRSSQPRQVSAAPRLPDAANAEHAVGAKREGRRGRAEAARRSGRREADLAGGRARLGVPRFRRRRRGRHRGRRDGRVEHVPPRCGPTPAVKTRRGTRRRRCKEKEKEEEEEKEDGRRGGEHTRGRDKNESDTKRRVREVRTEVEVDHFPAGRGCRDGGGRAGEEQERLALHGCGVWSKERSS